MLAPEDDAAAIVRAQLQREAGRGTSRELERRAGYGLSREVGHGNKG